ncbi:uncharacterized protein LOC133030385 [Cannabis sativa]|uniref:uncharacterized protein LOC133030385 n=1 Tax=Cannabis sativa TaxID=3483 RepID=UPI0029CA6E1D|nr:uncharacterized protein LOC133030385 [Cannabis sativa]
MAENFDDDGVAQQIVNPIILADDRARAIREYAAPMFNELNPGIVRPEIQAPQFELKPTIASNNYQWSNTRVLTSRKVAGVLEVDAITALTAQMASMTNVLKNLSIGNAKNIQPAAAIQSDDVSCVFCGEGHAFEKCLSNSESVCYMGNQNFNRNNGAFSNSYNQSWKNHPTLSWGGQGASSSTTPAQGRQAYPPGFSQQPRHPQHAQNSQPSSLESLMRDYMAKNDAVIQSQAASLRNLELQLGHLANELKARPQGSLPSDTENPRRDGKEQCKSIHLRSEIADTAPLDTASGQQSDSQQSAPVCTKPPIPFPQRFRKQQQDGQFKKFLDVLKQLHINIPLVEALEQMPNYVKFLKDILTKKRRLGEFETVALTEGCSAMLKSKIPPKLKDPGSFTIPCSIGGRDVGRALCDLGASINLMPMSIFKKLVIGEACPTTVTLQLADRSMAHPEGKIEDVLVQVDKFIFPADFIILDYEADRDVPIILGRPFLATERTLIDVQNGELTMRVNDQKVTFNVFNAKDFRMR